MGFVHGQRLSAKKLLGKDNLGKRHGHYPNHCPNYYPNYFLAHGGTPRNLTDCKYLWAKSLKVLEIPYRENLQIVSKMWFWGRAWAFGIFQEFL